MTVSARNWLDAALRCAGPGQTIRLPPGRHASAVGVIDEPGLVLAGDGAELAADGTHVEGKAILVVRAPGVVIEDLTFSGARVPAGNGAGIRLESGSLTLRRCRFVDNETGVMTANRADIRLVIDDCEFADAPRHDNGRLHHLLYVGAIDTCVVTRSRFRNGWVGHLLKSRARVSRVLWSEFVDGPDGEASYELEFPNGGDILVQDNRIEPSARSRNRTVLSVGAEARGRSRAQLVLRDNHFVSAVASTRFVQVWTERLAGKTEIDASGNRFDGPGHIGLP